MRTPTLLLTGLLLLAAGAWLLLGDDDRAGSSELERADAQRSTAREAVLVGAPSAREEGRRPATDPEDEPVLAGRVLEAGTGRPIEGARVVAFDLVRRERLEFTTGPDGRYRFDGTAGRASAFGLRVEARGHAPRLLRRSIPSRLAADLALDAAGFLTGRVEAADGGVPSGLEVLAVPRLFANDADVDLIPWIYHVLIPEDAFLARARPDATGRFRLGPLAPGAYALVLRTPSRAPVVNRGGAKSWDRTGGFEVAAGATNDLGTLVFPAAAGLEVRVVDDKTREVLRAVTFHSVIRVDRRDYVFPLPGAVLLEDGAWRLELDAAKQGLGANVVRVSAEGCADAPLSFSGSVPAGFRFEVALTPVARLRGRVLDDDGRPVPHPFVFVRRDVDAQILHAAAADASGVFRTGDLEAHRPLEVVVLDSTLGRLLSLVPLQLEPGEERELVLGGPDTRALEVAVRRDGAPLAGTWLSLDTPDDRRTQFTADAEGRVRFDGIPAGRAGLFASIGDRETYCTCALDVAADGVTEVVLDFRWTVAGTLLVEDAEGVLAPRDAVTIEARRDDDPTGIVCESDSQPDGSFRILLPESGTWRLGPSEAQRGVLVVREGASVEALPGEAIEPVRLVLSEDPMSGVVSILVRSAESGEPLEDAEYVHRYRATTGAGVVDEGRIEGQDLGYGDHTYVVSGRRHAPVVIVVRIGPDRRHVEAQAELPLADCVRVTELSAASRARDAGVEVGDLLLRYGDTRVRCILDLRAAMNEASGSGRDTVRLTLLRDGAERQLDLPTGRMGVHLVNHAASVD